MFKKRLLIIFIAFFCFFEFVGAHDVFAQCSGSGSGCYTDHSCDASSFPAKCVDQGRKCVSSACTPQSGGTCGWQVWVNDSCAVKSDGTGCILGSGAPFGGFCASPPTPTPPPGSTPPPAQCSGACFGGISNCGQVGRQGASGSCSNGELCCGFGGGTSGPYCGNYNQYCGFSTGGACNASGPNGPPYTCIYCPATKPDDAWQPMGSFQYANCTNTVCGTAGVPPKPVWGYSTPVGIYDGAVILPTLYYFYFTSPGNNVETKYILQVDDIGIGAPWSVEWSQQVTQGEISYGNPRYWNYTFQANKDYHLIIYTMGAYAGCLSSPLVLTFTTKVSTVPTLTLTASPTSVPSNGSSTLTWSSTNATSCTAAGDWTGAKAVNGSQSQTAITTNKNYSLTCTGTGGSVTKSVTVNVIAAAPTLTLTASPTSVPSSGSSTLTWSSTNATSCTASGGWSGSKTVSGSQSQTGITVNKSYTLTCTGTGGSVSKTANVNVIGSPALPTVNLTASPTTVPSAGSTTLSWNTTNATSCTASNGWSGAKTTSGSQVITNNVTNKTFVLTCTGPGGSSNDSATLTVTVSSSAPTVTLTANPTIVPLAGSTTLTWSSTQATTCTASNGWTGSKTLSGSQIISNNISNKTFTLACTGPGGTTTRSASITILAAPLPTVNLTASPTSLVGPGSVTLRWTTTNATSCTASNGWSGAKVLNGSQVDPSVATSKTYALRCTNASGSTTDTATVTYTAPTCGLPAPRDPAPPVCAPNPPTQNGSITWTWPAVPGANQYSFSVVDANTGATIAGTSTGMINGQTNFNCRPNQATPDLCSKTTTLPPGSYRSKVGAGNSAGTCLPSAVVTYPPVNQPGKDVVLCPAVPWWQSGSGSVFSQGNIQSTIPASCTPPTCINNLIQNGNSSVPGIALGGSSSSISTGTGSVSSKNWVAQSSISGRVPDYDSFVSLIPVSITPSDPGGTIAGGAFNSGGATTGDGYSWYRHNGNTTITGNLSLNAGRKIIFFVDGNLTINGTITYNPSSAFFMPIVKGNIVIAPSVTTGAGTPTLTGIFYSDGSFTTGAGTAPLSVLGSVVAMGGVTMERDLGASNNFESAENYTISPELILNYPGALSFKRPIWREVAP